MAGHAPDGNGFMLRPIRTVPDPCATIDQRVARLEGMTEELALPESLIALREALRPVATKLATEMARQPERHDQEGDMLEFVTAHLAMIGEDVEQIEDEVNDALAVVASPADAQRAAARLEVQLERLLAHYDDVRRVNPNFEVADGWSLLGDVYHRVLTEIRGWLDELVEVLNEPTAALKARGQPTEGRVELSLPLTITASPELERLTGWAEEMAAGAQDWIDCEEAYQAKRSSLGFWALVLGAIGLGWMIGADDE